MSSGASQRKRRHSSREGVRVTFECLIEPRHLIAAGYVREAGHGDDRSQRIRRGDTEMVPDVARFCADIGYTKNAYHKIRRGFRQATADFRVRASRALRIPQDQLFRQVIAE